MIRNNQKAEIKLLQPTYCIYLNKGNKNISFGSKWVNIWWKKVEPKTRPVLKYMPNNEEIIIFLWENAH